MKFEIYCDESGLEALSNKEAHSYTGIGGIWIPADQRATLKEGIGAIKNRYNIHGELKWQKVSPAYLDLYKEVIDFFFNANYVRFRVILVEAQKVDNIRFHNADAELSFYKFYYQLLQHWIYDFNEYAVFVDLKINRNKGRLKELEKALDNSNYTSDITQVQGLPSDQSLGIQLADVLTGMATARFNRQYKSGSAKEQLINYVEQKYLDKEIVPTAKAEEKFNVFKINLQGGW
ncbi:DUF3800 domain-containing protein [Sphingobacterium corticibacter]|uniref:DUF3800 domain-containing protein n=1 Tax=Sphingobacterium corticibacter TaxID=2171749 RepID=A0A2T8HG72_9SPHI|nr:DUF3800 domain-containing protein [Sphingobacterium corticibacter]PVH24436.1 hypothetical protein DC487_12880 [Sphingobacterium corticibacter]